MKIVIEIPEEAYNLLKSDGVDWLGAEHILSCVEKGKVLPNGHGDLVDRSQALRTDCFGDGHDGLRAFHEYADYSKMREYLQHIPTIIPAEKEM